MTHKKIWRGVLGGILAAGMVSGLRAEPDSAPETANILDVGAPVARKLMSEDELEAFFQQQKKGTPLQLFLGKEKTVKGLFGSYDDYYETVWMVPKGEKGLFQEKSYKLSGIQSVAVWDRKDALPAGPVSAMGAEAGKYYLLKEDEPK